MAGWYASFLRRLRSFSASAVHSSAASEGRSRLVRALVNSSRVLVFGSIVAKDEEEDVQDDCRSKKRSSKRRDVWYKEL